MPVFIKVTKNNNKYNAAYGKWYGRVVSTSTMSYTQLCKHMSEHNSVYGEDVCLGVANKLQKCILEQLLEDISFEIPEPDENGKIIIDKNFVDEKFEDTIKKDDMDRYIL